MKKKKFWFSVIALIWCVIGTTPCYGYQVKNLTVEYEETPLGIDANPIRFGWQMQSSEQGAAQSAYQLVVTNEQGREMWNSGQVKERASQGITYHGQPLQPTTRYHWTVCVWNEKGEQQEASSWFETGLMADSDQSPAWSGARWIGGGEEAKAFYSQYLPVFRISYDVTLGKRCQSASFLYGANDQRLMDRNKNILGVCNAKDASYIRIELTVQQLNIYRVGYVPTDKADVPFASFPINSLDVAKTHHIEIASLSGTTDILLDGSKLGTVGLNPAGKGGDYTAFPVVGDIGYSVPKGQTAFFTHVEIHNWRQPRNLLSSHQGMTVKGKTEIFTPRETGQTVLRTAFKLAEKAVSKARLYISARGEYDLTLNGQRISEDYLNPGMTQYEKTLFYQTYDVTPYINKDNEMPEGHSQGKNEIRATLGEGWWSGGLSYDMANWNFFGDRQSLIAKLVVTYEDGTVQTVVSDPASWEYSTEGPVRYGSLFQGEIYDARLQEIAQWKPAVEVPLEGVISHEKNMWPTPDDYSQFRLIAQIGKPVRPYSILTAQSVKEVRPGVWIYDMGQNMPGVPRLTFSNLPAGTEVKMRFAEVCYPDLPAYHENVGMVMMENIRAAMAQDIYIAQGSEREIFQPRHTYHGYRYVEITGLPKALPLEAVQGVVLSSIDRFTAHYETSDTLLNRLFENVKWSSLANVFSIPTDCPQRNERMGWSGDLSVFSPAVSYIFNGAQFLNRHLLALRNTQASDGTFAAIAPIGGGFGGPLWQSVGIVMPWQSYLQYGDMEAVRQHYPAMKQYIELMIRTRIDSVDGHFIKGAGWGELGDWLGFEMSKTDNIMLFDCYLTYELGLMQKMALAINYQEDAERYAQIRRQRIAYINAHYFSPMPVSQTSLAVPLALGVVDKNHLPTVGQQLAEAVASERIGDNGKTYPPYSLTTGFAGCSWISLALSDTGHSSEAYRQLLNRHFPSWLYPVTQGATTIWERLNSMTHEDGFGGNNSMNSFNHYAFGSVANWLMQRSIGIARDENTPGFQHFILRPEVDPTGTLQFARGHYDSLYGRIESSWQRNADGTITYCFTIPANTSATFLLPGQKPQELTAGKYVFSGK